MPGPALVLVFVLTTAARDLWFGGTFQSRDLFAVAFLAFATATAVFAAAAWRRDRGQLRALARSWRLVLLVNLATAAAWLSYFYALGALEPAVVNTLNAGIGPLTVAVAGLFGLAFAREHPLGAGEWVLQAGVLAVLAALGLVVVCGLSGFAPAAGLDRLAAVAAALGSGIAITLALVLTRRLNARGVGADGVLASRFLAVVLIAGLAAAGRHTLAMPPMELARLAAAALLLIAAPLYLLQLGFARTAPFTAEALSAVGPVLVFAGQALEGRIPASPWTLAAILAYAVLALLAAALRGVRWPRLTLLRA
jgi:drug/metabolite transporter (DMT)-like permease